jgi:D-amino acid aminotransferase
LNVHLDLDGKLVAASDARVSPFDGGYQYGDGIFDTLRTYRGHPFALDRHLARLDEEARLLQIPFQAQFGRWRARIHRLLGANDLLDTDAAVRIQIARGGSPTTDLVLTPPEDIQPVEFVVARPVSEEVTRHQQMGVAVMTVQSSFARGNFPSIKSLNYLPSIMALRFARASGFQEACLLDREGKVLEGAMSNVFCVHEGTLRTPPLSMGLLPGITRAHVLELAHELKLPAEESPLDLRDLLQSREVFLTGSVKEIFPVLQVDEARIADGDPGPWTRQLQRAYHDRVEASRQGRTQTGAAS